MKKLNTMVLFSITSPSWTFLNLYCLQSNFSVKGLTKNGDSELRMVSLCT